MSAKYPMSALNRELLRGMLKASCQACAFGNTKNNCCRVHSVVPTRYASQGYRPWCPDFTVPAHGSHPAVPDLAAADELYADHDKMMMDVKVLDDKKQVKSGHRRFQ